jgi:hypothetical protein
MDEVSRSQEHSVVAAAIDIAKSVFSVCGVDRTRGIVGADDEQLRDRGHGGRPWRVAPRARG